LDLEIQLRFCFKRNLPLRIDSLSVSLSIRQLVRVTPNSNSRRMKLLSTSGNRDGTDTQRETKGETHTYLFFPDVRTRLRAVWFEPDFYTTQLISGHGNVKARFAQFGFATDSVCTCGPVEQDVNHIL